MKDFPLGCRFSEKRRDGSEIPSHNVFFDGKHFWRDDSEAIPAPETPRLTAFAGLSRFETVVVSLGSLNVPDQVGLPGFSRIDSFFLGSLLDFIHLHRRPPAIEFFVERNLPSRHECALCQTEWRRLLSFKSSGQ
uniref:hypothetical protein n=1 Tax=Leptospirillum ferrooxidans TaxID=180 RepID=UPI00155DD8EC